MTTIMISGHLDLTPAEFDLHYKDKLDKAIALGCDFVVGDARGGDTMAQAYLKDKGVKVTVYYPGTEGPRNNVGNYPTKGGYTGKSWNEACTARDAAMTADSDADIAWVRVIPGSKRVSGTQKNLNRRVKQNETRMLPVLTQSTMF
jgi:hypothetical protein